MTNDPTGSWKAIQEWIGTLVWIASRPAVIALKRDLLLKNNLPDKVFCPSAYPTPYM